ncbi:exodeoxyribonuclease V subunit gamma [Peribacillus simplex]|uniref:exodeoxyribonuclease V subunit gamma n=1 Tax=Peribacillus simplex TaxID=1478 RepID=UPI0011A891E8|nr:exodeoxyribonuclease V subunit gamma [Peribacillus simplex]
MILFQYQNRRPNNDLVNQELGLCPTKSNYMFLTATKKLAHERIKLIPEHQAFPRNNPEKPKALFGDVLKGLVKDHFPGRVAAKHEEQTLLNRVIENVAASNPKLRNILEKDRGSLLKTLKDLAEKNINLTNRLPPGLQDTLLEPVLEQLLPEIQKGFYHELLGKGKCLYEKLAGDYIDHFCVPHIFQQFGRDFIIVMEGFTFLTDLQKRLIDVCIKNDLRIYFLIPNDPSQGNAFEVIEDTYNFVPSGSRKWIVTDAISEQTDLQHLHGQLFSKNALPYSSEGVNVLVQKYPNRDQELIAILQQIQELLDEGYQPSQIAIVMRRKREFLYRLGDLMQMHPIYYTKSQNGQEVRRPVKLPISPRMLLLTPVGRFILTLYEIWENDKLSVEADQFEIILGSGWLGAKAQDLTPKFRSVKHQFFTQCKEKDDWLPVLDSLLPLCRIRKEDSRLPMGILDQRMIRTWKEIICLLEEVCEKLFSAGEGSIGHHIRRLQDQLKDILPGDLRKSEKLILEKVMEVFQELEQEHTIELSTEEFSRTLHALVSDDNIDEDEMEDSPKEGDLSIFSPESIDGIHKRAVLYIGVDNQHVPVMYTESWPFFEDKRNEHLKKERYMFLTVIRAAQEKLVLSYAVQDADRTYQPSVYIGRVLSTSNIALQNFEITDSLDLSNAPEVTEIPDVIPATRTNYELHELAHYGLCPARYRMEILHPEARMYRMDWQLPFAVQGEWLHQIFNKLVQEVDYIPFGDPLQIKDYFIKTLNAVEPVVHQQFPALTPITWHGIKSKVEYQLIYHHWAIRGPHLQGIRDAEFEVFAVVNEEEETIDIEYEVPFYWETRRFDVPIVDTILHSEWLLPSDPTKTDGELVLIDGVRVFSSLRHGVNWWRSVIYGHYYDKNNMTPNNNDMENALAVFNNSSELILEWIEGVENNKFPKNQGTHCNKCPVRMECLGIVLDNDGGLEV